MKTKILFMLLLFFINLCFGQENWGSWTPNKCFKGIYSRVRFDSHNNGYVQVTNKYSKKVAFRASVQDGLGSLDFTLKPSEIQGVGPVGKSINNHLNLIIEKVCFNFLKTGELCVETKNTQEASYAECDNGTPNYKPRNLNKVNSNNSNKNSINSISNDSNSNQQSDIYETVDEIPNFPGGINAFRQKAAANFDTSDIAGSGKAKTEVTFLVEKDGTISNIQASGNNLQLNDAASRAVSLVKEKWTPAKLNGNIVKYRFRIPFAIDLESEVTFNNTKQNQDSINKIQRQQTELNPIAEENAQRAEEERQRKSQSKQELINLSVNAATELINYFATRKNALRNSLTQEDAQALLAIVNSENPLDYLQNIIQIFSDLGYTYRETKKRNDITIITMNNDVQNINDFLNIFIRPAKGGFDRYNSISFSYHRRKKLLEQLSVLGNNLKGFDIPTIEGIPPSVQKLEEEKKYAEEQWKAAFQKQKPVVLGNPSKDITIQKVIDKSINAIGGIEKLKTVQSITRFIKDLKTGEKSKSIYARGRFTIEGISNSNTFKTTFNGISGYGEFNGTRTNFDRETVLLYKDIQPIDILTLQQSPDLSLGPNVIFFETECYTIVEKSRFKGLDFVKKHFFEVVSGLWIGTEELVTGSNYSTMGYIYYTNYKEVNGILFPLYKSVFYENGDLSMTETTEIKIDEPLNDKDFE